MMLGILLISYKLYYLLLTSSECVNIHLKLEAKNKIYMKSKLETCI